MEIYIILLFSDRKTEEIKLGDDLGIQAIREIWLKGITVMPRDYAFWKGNLPSRKSVNN